MNAGEIPIFERAPYLADGCRSVFVRGIAAVNRSDQPGMSNSCRVRSICGCRGFLELREIAAGVAESLEDVRRPILAASWESSETEAFLFEIVAFSNFRCLCNPIIMSRRAFGRPAKKNDRNKEMFRALDWAALIVVLRETGTSWRKNERLEVA